MSGYGTGLYGTETYGECEPLLPSASLYPSVTLLPGCSEFAVPVPGEGESVYVVSSERPPLELHAEVGMPDGSTTMWHSGAREPGNRPQGITFSTARMDGFKAGSCSLPRRIDQPTRDLALFNMIRFVGAQGDIAYEGRMAALPRESGSPSTWSVQAAGLMSNAKDRRFRMIFVDRDMSQWHEPPIERRTAIATGGYAQGKLSSTVDGGGLTWEIPNEALPTNEHGELWYDAGPGVTIAAVDYKGVRTGTWTSFEAATLQVLDDVTAAVASSEVITLDDTAHRAATFTPGRYAMLRALTTGAVTPPVNTTQRYTLMNMFGDHGLPITTVVATDGLGAVAASDVITWLIENYCPDLNAGGVQTTTYGISHLVFRDRTYPYDAMLTANSFHRWGLECWEGGTVHYGPLDLTDYDWELRLDDFGTQLAPQGPVAEEVANGIEVEYTDAATGRQEVLLPDDWADLRDTNPLNPVNRAGGYKTTEFSISTVCTQDDALQIGRTALAEFNAPKHKGTATVRGYIRDRAGNQQPVWKVRAGDRVVITDSVDEEVHVVVETDYSHDDKTLRMSVDDTFSRVDAYLDRYANAAANRGY
jgi:hypothetical protein